jgi:mannosyltransferase
LQQETGTGQPRARRSAGERASLGIIFLTLMAFALYTHTLDRQSLWFDEGLSVIFAAKPLPQLIHTLVYEDLHPPLYYLILHLWIILAGNSEWAVRMPSALAAILLVPLAFAIVRQVCGEGRRMNLAWAAIGLAAAGLVGTSPFIAYYAQETRMYSIAAALSLATTWAFLKASRARSTWHWCLFGCLLAASLYTQYFAVFLLPAYWLYILLLDRQSSRGLALGTALAGLLYLPWLRPAQMQLGRLLRAPDYWVTTRINVDLFLRAMWSTFLPNVSARLGLAALFLVSVLIIRFAHQRRLQLSQRVRRSILVLLTLLIPLILTYAVITLAPKFAARYAIVAAAPVYIFATLAIYPLLSHHSVWARAFAGLLLIAAIIISLPATMATLRAQRDSRDDARGLGAYLTQHAQADDVLLLVENAPYALQYYYQGPTPHYGLHVGQNFEHAAQVLNNILQRDPRRVWLVRWHHEFADPTDMIVTELLRVGREASVSEQFAGYQLRAFDIVHDDQPIAAYPEPSTSLDVTFSPGLHLLGFDRFSNEAGQLHYVLYWQALGPMEQNYSLTLTFQDSEGNEYLRQDQALSTDYFLPPAWPEGTPIRGRVDVHLPPDLPALTYQVDLQVLDPSAHRNLDLVDDRGAPLGQRLLLEQLQLAKSAMSQGATNIQNPLQENMGEGLQLRGFDVPRRDYSPGDTLRLTLWWQRVGSTMSNPQIHFRLLGSGDAVAWESTEALLPGYAPVQWQMNEVNRAIYRLALPSDLPGGDHLLQVGDGNQWRSLAALHIVPREHQYERPPMQQTLALRFEQGITLLGYDLQAPSPKPGEKISVTLYWQAEERLSTSYKVGVQLLSSDLQIAAQDDSIPARWTYPTTAWLPGEIVTDEHVLTIASDAAPASYILIVVLYDERNASRLGVERDGTVSDHAVLTVLDVG